MRKEINVPKRIAPWDNLGKPRNKRVARCIWIFTLNYKEDATIEKYKVRLVAKIYAPTYKIVYEKTFALIAKMNTIQVVLALTTHYSWDLHQLDVNNVFFHGALKEVYVEIPLGFETHSGRNKTCLLKKVSYGLK